MRSGVVVSDGCARLLKVVFFVSTVLSFGTGGRHGYGVGICVIVGERLF